mgnify:CR=1 FL=1
MTQKSKLFCVIAISALSCTSLNSQISINENLLFGQAWSKELTEIILQTYVETSLDIENMSFKTYDVWSMTASSSGDLTTAYYKSDDGKGVVFVLYLTTGGTGEYTIKDFKNNDGEKLLTQLDSFIEEFNEKRGEDRYYDRFVFRYDDLLFVMDNLSLDVIYNGIKADWSIDGAKRFIRRAQKGY